MFTIPKHGATQTLQNTLLDDVVGRSLRLGWSGDPAHDETVKRFLYECHERGRWIQCDCVIDPTSHARPLLAVRRTESTITLARMTGPDRVRHAATCIFDQGSLDIGTGDGDDVPVNEALGLSRATRAREIAQGSLSVPIKPPTFYLDPAALRLAAQQSEPQPPQERSAPSEPTPENNRIGRRMLYLMQGAQLNVLRRMTDHPAKFRQLLEFCKEVPIPRGGTLFQMIQARPRAFENGYLAKCAREAANRGFGSTCWWICPIVDFDTERGVFLANDDDVDVVAPVPGHIRFFGGKIEAVVTRFPALMLARCDESGVLDAYAHPILSIDRWCLVDSHLEREVLNEICLALPGLADRFDVDVVIHKPLYVWNDTGERPDVVLTAAADGADHHLIIAVMGFTDDKYASRKVELRQRVLAMPRCTYVEDKRANDVRQSKDHMKDAISAWLQTLSAER